MPDYDDKPTREFIKSFKDYFTGLWSPTHNNLWKPVDEYYEQSFQVWPAQHKNRPVSHTSWATQIIDHAADTMLSSMPTFHREPSGEGEGHAADASIVERAVTAAFTAMSMREPVPPFKLVNRYFCAYGYAGLSGVTVNLSDKPKPPQRREGEEKEEWEERQLQHEMEKRNWMPFRLSAPHPASVLMDPEEKQPPAALQKGYRSAIDLHRLTMVEKARGVEAEVWTYDPQKPFERVRVWDYWTRRWHVVLAGEDPQILYRKRNLTGIMPFSHAFAGWSHQPLNLLPTDPIPWARGLLWPVLEDIKRGTQRISAEHNILLRVAFAPMATRPNIDATLVAEAIARDKMIENLDKGDLFFPELPEVQAWMFRIGEENRRDIEDATYSRELAGAKLEGADTLGQQAMRSHQMYLKFETANQQLAELASIAASHFLRLVDAMGETVTIRGVTLSPKQIHHDYTIIAEFKASDPVIQLQRQNLAQADANAVPPKISDETYRAVAGYEDENQEVKRLLKQDVIRDPAVHSMLVAVEAKRMGLEKLRHEIEELEAEERRLRSRLGGDGQEAGGQVDILGRPLEQPGSQGVGELRQPISERVAKPGEPNLGAIGR